MTRLTALAVIAQAAPADSTDVVQIFLTAGVAGAVLIAAITGFIFFKPERTQLLETVAELRTVNERYVELHHNTTLPTLHSALSQLEAVEKTLKALTKAWEEEARTSTEVIHRLEALERQVGSFEGRLR